MDGMEALRTGFDGIALPLLDTEKRRGGCIDTTTAATAAALQQLQHLGSRLRLESHGSLVTRAETVFHALRNAFVCERLWSTEVVCLAKAT